MGSANGIPPDTGPEPLLQRFPVRTLVIFRALQLGDMLCAVPALRAMRARLPDAGITLVGLPWAKEFASRFRHYIDDFIPFPGHPALPEQSARQDQFRPFYQTVRARHFHLAIQLHGSGEVSNTIVSAFGAQCVAGFVADGNTPADRARFLEYPDQAPEPLRLLQLAEFLGAPSMGTHLEFPLTGLDERELAESGVGAGLAPGSYICIHPGARSRDKCWPPHRFAEVADRLWDEFGLTVVLTGSQHESGLTAAVAEHMAHRPVDAAAPISIGAMGALMSRSRLLICNDTGVSHMAAGLGLPSVVIFRRSDIHRWSPLDHRLHRPIWDPEGTHTQAVLENARALLGETRRPA